MARVEFRIYYIKGKIRGLQETQRQIMFLCFDKKHIYLVLSVCLSVCRSSKKILLSTQRNLYLGQAVARMLYSGEKKADDVYSFWLFFKNQ